jgi:hypothetical protein
MNKNEISKSAFSISALEHKMNEGDIIFKQMFKLSRYNNPSQMDIRIIFIVY